MQKWLFREKSPFKVSKFFCLFFLYFKQILLLTNIWMVYRIFMSFLIRPRSGLDILFVLHGSFDTYVCLHATLDTASGTNLWFLQRFFQRYKAMEVYRGKNITIDRINLFSSFKIIINNVLCIVSVSLSYKYMVAILVKFSIVRRCIAKHSAITHNTSCKKLYHIIRTLRSLLLYSHDWYLFIVRFHTK